MRKLVFVFLMHLSLSAFAVVQGNETVPHSKPFQVGLFIDDLYFCGGVLISPEWVLTAAYCVEGAQLVEVVLGTHNIRLNEPEQVRMTTADFFHHENWNSVTLANDIALIRLPVPVQLNESINIIHLASNDVPVGAGVEISGWGKTSDRVSNPSDVLNEGVMSTISQATCNAIYGIVTDQMICAEPAFENTCTGDGGGPLVYNGKLHGIVSFGASAGCEAGFPSVFTDVSKYFDWIAVNCEQCIPD